MSTHIQNALRRNDAWLPWRYGVGFVRMRLSMSARFCGCVRGQVCVCVGVGVCVMISVCVRTVIITTEEVAVGAGSRSEPEYPESTRSTPTVSTPRVPPCEYSENAAAAAPHRRRLVNSVSPKKRKVPNYDDSPMQSRSRRGKDEPIQSRRRCGYRREREWRCRSALQRKVLTW